MDMNSMSRGASDFLKKYTDLIKQRAEASSAVPDFSYSEVSDDNQTNKVKQTEYEKRMEEFKKILNGGR